MVSVYAIMQFFGFDLGIWSGNIGKKVVFSTLGNPTLVGEFVLCALPFSLVGLFIRRKAVYSIICALFILTVFLTFSKVLWFILLAQIAVFLLLFY